jgi:quinolinate synthase
MGSPTVYGSDAPIEQKILRLKKEMNAVILAHYYQVGPIQDVADFVGDSLELSRRAMATDADVIVFAGVHFMAEVAKILNPEKRVLLPDLNAGCSLAESAPAHLFRKFREAHPDHLSMTYINSTAEVKALSDIICTSSSAEKILGQIPPERPVLFAPDRNLGRYLSKQSGREMLLWQGTCSVHEQFTAEKLLAMKTEHPDALLIAHPECNGGVLQLADYIGSTSGLLAFVQRSSASSFIVATEPGILHQMARSQPDKILLPAPPEDGDCNCSDCPYMKLNTMEKLHASMVRGAPEIVLNEELRRRALLPIERMLALSGPIDEREASKILCSIELPFHANSLN